MPTCKWVCPRLVPFLLGELPTRQALAVAAHVARCPACREAVQALRATVAAATPASPPVTPASLPAPPAPAPVAVAPRPPALPPLDAAHVRALVRPVRAQAPSRPLVWVATAAVVLALAAFLTRAPELLSPPVVGTVFALSGRPEVCLSGQTWQPLTAQASLPKGASVRTGETDQLELQLSDGSRVKLDFSTELRLGARLTAGQATPRADLQLAQGHVWLLVTHAQSGLRVHTAAGTAEALGTVFEVFAQPGHETPGLKGPYPEAQVTVLRGQVRVSNQQGSVVAQEGTVTAARAGRAPDPPRTVASLASINRLSPWGQTMFEVWVLPELTRGDAAWRMVGARGWLGLTLAPSSTSLSGDPRPGSGLTVKHVAPDSPAARAGLVAGDRLLRVGEVELTRPSDLFISELRYLPNGKEQVELTFLRGDETTQARVACAAPPQTPDTPSDGGVVAANRSFALGRLATAQQGYQSLIHSPEAAAALHNLGVLEEMAGRNTEAAAHYRQALQQGGRGPRFHFSLAMALARLGNLRGAIRELQSTLAADPRFPQARFQLGRMEGFVGSFDAAQQQVARLQADPDTLAQGLFLAGELDRLQNKLADAVSHYQEAVVADPLSADASTALGATYHGQGNFGKARSWLRRALVVEPDSVRALSRLGLVLYKQGDLDGALAAFQEADAKHPGYALVQNDLGMVYLKQGRVREALAAYQHAAKLEPSGLYARMGLAMTYEQARKFADAKRQYRLVLSLDPTYKEGYDRLAALHRSLGELQSARTVEKTARQYGL